MPTLSSLFARFTGGRREKLARTWDQIADRCASQAKFYAQAIASASIMGVKVPDHDHFRQKFKEAQAAEKIARDTAARIRKGPNR